MDPINELESFMTSEHGDAEKKFFIINYSGMNYEKAMNLMDSHLMYWQEQAEKLHSYLHGMDGTVTIIAKCEFFPEAFRDVLHDPFTRKGCFQRQEILADVGVEPFVFEKAADWVVKILRLEMLMKFAYFVCFENKKSSQRIHVATYINDHERANNCVELLSNQYGMSIERV